MSAPHDGGPAFPTLTGLSRDMRDDFSAEVDAGMTQRAYFAGRALSGMLANPTPTCRQPSDYAHYAVQCADALLRELAK